MGTRSRGKRDRGETYRVGTGSGLTGVVSERVLTEREKAEYDHPNHRLELKVKLAIVSVYVVGGVL